MYNQMKIVDLTHTFVNSIQVYPGDTPPTLQQTHTIERDGFTNHLLTTGMHAGTHIDGSWHMTDNRRVIADMPVEKFTGTSCIIDISNTKEFKDADLVKRKCIGCDMVLFYTGYGKLFGTGKYLSGYPVIGTDVALQLVVSGIKLTGTDTFSPDYAPYSVHKILLGNGVLIAENLTNLDQLLSYKSFRLIALPLKMNADSSPARVIALVEG